MTLVARLLEQAARTPAEVALVAGDGAELTYGDLRRRVLAVRHGLLAAGMEPGDGVLFSVRPSPESLVLALGVVAAGGVVVFADPGAGPEMFTARLGLARPRWSAAESVLYAGSRLRPVRAYARRRGLLLPNLADLRIPGDERPMRHVFTGRRLPGVPRGALSFASLAAGDAPEEPFTGDPDAPAAVIFTSGTTANPRAVVHTQGSLAAALDLFRERLPLGPGDVVHTDQLMLGLPTLISGARWSMPPLFCPPADFARLLAERGATHTFCVPVHLAEVLDAAPRLPGHLRYVLLGAAPAPAGVLRRAVAAAPSAKVLSVYAMTEILPVALASAEDKLAHTASGAGGDLLGEPLVDAVVAGDGELLLSGPNLCRGYLGEPPLDRLPTGDLARIDDGRLVLTGRKKDMLIRGKFNLYPGLYEPAVAALPGVVEAAYVGLPDPETGDEEVVLAVVGATAGLDRRLRDVIDHDALPDRIVAVPGLPRSGRGRKLDRERLGELVRRGER
ncbi:class I adenylate-forming enzyme family protein [Actinomadura kijaniata]|uniref:Acyl-CoA synthetase (AMP-forming)/AMP-acid ligase II n=1 Tax=Actinomadura namibiensis TaxID=182080 RepID=A0A7W3QJ59_ACTNM|nr:class I adenylate-forming enzyme family protein [Actinomadura namibiensis]MBA8949031.1 acyl-CoA synthetase (AMP-forming)/AMP-acid ligase II [Actinomadura namibiensis]